MLRVINLWLKNFSSVRNFLYRNVPKTSDEQKLNFLNWNFFSRVMVNIVVIDRTNKHSNRCVDKYDSQRINSFLPIFTVILTV